VVDGTRITTITRPDGSSFEVRVPWNGMTDVRGYFHREAEDRRRGANWIIEQGESE